MDVNRYGQRISTVKNRDQYFRKEINQFTAAWYFGCEGGGDDVNSRMFVHGGQLISSANILLINNYIILTSVMHVSYIVNIQNYIVLE